MDLVKWIESPFDSIERTFRDTMNNSFRLARRFSDLDDVFVPNLDFSEDKDGYYLITELPGMNENDLKVTVDNDVLTISGTKERKEEKKARNYHRLERSFGEFACSLSVPKNVKMDQIQATFKNGLLEITLPKTQSVAPQAREITLNSGTKQNGQIPSNGKAVLA